ncbi:MAG TPA: hypothetical protein VFQ45_11890 [Longimicrobium sp.]|nr:hypothetical protein [Longimicrobium sp.]
MEPERIDLSPLALPAARRTALAAAVLARAQVGRAAPRGPLAVLAGWARPTLAAAAAVAGVSLAALAWSGTRAATEESTQTLAEALIPERASPWVSEGATPSGEDLLAGWEASP